MTKLKRRDVVAAISSVLKLNYRKRLLDIEIHPLRVTMHYAVSFLRDPEQKWMPRVITYYDEPGTVMIQEYLGDPNPLPINASTLVFMAENHTHQEPPTGPFSVA